MIVALLILAVLIFVVIVLHDAGQVGRGDRVGSDTPVQTFFFRERVDAARMTPALRREGRDRA